MSTNKNHDMIMLISQTALMAALCYVGFEFLRIDISLPGGSTAVHLGNAFLVLAALLLGGVPGGIAGAVGMSIADLTSGVYVTSAPKTFLIKFLIGLVVGLLAHHFGHINAQNDPKKRTMWVLIASAGGMLFNLLMDPVISYLYKRFLLGMTPDAADILVKWGALSTLVNAVIAVLIASLLYFALVVPLKKIGMIRHSEKV